MYSPLCATKTLPEKQYRSLPKEKRTPKVYSESQLKSRNKRNSADILKHKPQYIDQTDGNPLKSTK